MDTITSFSSRNLLKSLDDLVKDEENFRMKNNLRLNKKQQELCNMKGFLDLLWEAIIDPYFTLFWIYLAMNVSFLLYHALRIWYFQSMSKLLFHFPRIRKYLGCVIGMFSFSISWKVVSGVENCHSAIYLILFSCLLGAIAVLIPKGFKGRCSSLFGLIICIIGALTFVFSAINHFSAEVGQYYDAQAFYGIFLLILGGNLIYMSHWDKTIAERLSWRRRCGLPYQMNEVVIHYI